MTRNDNDIYRGNVFNYIKSSLSKISPEDRGDVERFIDDLAARGYWERRILKIASTLAWISPNLSVSFRDAQAGILNALLLGLRGAITAIGRSTAIKRFVASS